MPRFLTTIALVTLLSVLVQGQVHAQKVDPTRAKTLTVEQATELLKQPNSLRLSVMDLPSEVAVVLAKYKGELRFDALTTLVPEAAAALATREGALDLPKLTSLSPAVAKALSAHAGQLSLGVTELSDDAAAALAKHTGEIQVSSLKSLTSLALATRLGQQEYVSLGAARLTPEIARALCPPGNREKFKNHVQFNSGLTELPADVAAAIMAGRSHPSLNSLESISDEAAATWAGPFANIRLFGLKTLTPGAAASLTMGGGIFDIRNFGPEVSDETAAAIAKQMASGPHRMIDFNGLKKLTSPALAVALLSRYHGGPHSSLNGVAEITDDVAKALAESKGKLNGLPSLTSLTSAPLAAKYAAQPGDLKFAKLTTIPDDVAKAFATHKGKLDLAGLQSLSDESAKALARHEGEVILTGLTMLSDSSASILRGNEKIKLAAKLQKR
ncbi:MAG: hypothetical protein EXR98_23425 [Gemmataceae bacterium]|nr:hypothetical protein [Gemmataceae bacterium]